jgi:hypothetical protein
VKYKIKEFRMIESIALYPSDSASQFASDEDDREVVKASQGDVGTLQPLIVSDNGDGSYSVLDGLGRLDGARQRVDSEGRPDPIPELPCLVVECDDPRSLALHINSAGRKRSTGSRILCFLLANQELVMRAREAVDQGGLKSRDCRPLEKGKSRNEIPDALKPWTIAGISGRLGVSNKDVQMALELMICRDTLTYPSRATFGRYAVGESMKGDDGSVEALDKAFVGVMCGRTPVRRWAAAFAGRATNDGKGKADTDYAMLADRTATSLLGAFENWHKAQWQSPEHRERVEQRLASALAVMPECCRAALIELIPQSWKASEQASLVKAIGRK